MRIKPWLLPESYFTIRRWEGDGAIYRWFGVGLYAKYWPNGGSWWTSRQATFGDFQFPGFPHADGLRRFIAETKCEEEYHLFWSLAPIALAIAFAVGVKEDSPLEARIAFVWLPIGFGTFSSFVCLYAALSMRLCRIRAEPLYRRKEARALQQSSSR